MTSRGCRWGRACALLTARPVTVPPTAALLHRAPGLNSVPLLDAGESIGALAEYLGHAGEALVDGSTAYAPDVHHEGL